ncbi:MAG TPA: cytochrome C oxidase subunit IV family protein [Candidatus Limnocylindrales bacterium]|nr:cytochrome C oxidase subunit IV family protein [Candidatus Limnocylindrales bacterium]
MSEHIVPVKIYVFVFIALLILTGLTTGVAYIDLGPFNTVVALAIAAVKMMLVVLFFMHVKYSSGMTRLVVLAGLFWLAILLSFTLADELTRGWTPVPMPWSPSMLLPFVLSIF